MALSLHSEYLLGYLAGAKNLPLREVIPFALIGTDGSPQNRALLKALALGLSDGRRSRSLREAHEVRIHVLAMLTREAQPGKMSRFGAESTPPSGTATTTGHDSLSDPGIQIEAFIEQASQIG